MVAEEKQVYHSGLEGICRAIQVKFKIPCYKQLICSRWRQMTPPFPQPRERGDYNESECFEWVQLYIIGAEESKTGQESLFFKGKLAKSEIEIVKLEDAKWESQNKRGLYELKSEGARRALAMARKQHAIIRQAVESDDVEPRVAFLKDAGASDVLISAYREFAIKRGVELITWIEARYKEDT